MKEALEEARNGLQMGEVPIGAVLVAPDKRVIAKTHNQPIFLNDPTAHAEILALRMGGEVYKNYRLPDLTLVVTIEPCPMCMGAALNARISRLVFGAFDPKGGAAVSLYTLANDKRLNHRIEIVSGIMKDQCSILLKEFFSIRRNMK